MHHQDLALELLKEVEATLLRLGSLSADIEGFRHLTDPSSRKTARTSFTGTIQLLRPNLAQVRFRSGTREVLVVADGKALWQWERGKPEYTRSPLDDAGRRITVSDSLPVGWPVEAFFQTRIPHIEAAPTLRHEGRFRVIEFPDPPQARQQLYISADNLPYRYRNVQLGGRYVAQWALKNVKLNPPLSPASFRFTPPPGTREYVPPPPPKLLAPGTPAPDFTLSDEKGQPVALASLRGKVVVLDFWAVSCGPCLEAFPHNNTVAQQFGEDVVFLAAHVQDSPENFTRWRTKNPGFPALRFLVDPAPLGKELGTRLYKVFGLPTVYVIDKDGKIAKGFVGFSGPTPALEQAILAAGGTRR